MDLSVLNLRRARAAEDDVVSLKQYAQMLEAELADYKAGLKGVSAVKDEALKELARVDPKHFLLVKENRERIYDEAYYQEAPQKKHEAGKRHDIFGLKSLLSATK